MNGLLVTRVAPVAAVVALLAAVAGLTGRGVPIRLAAVAGTAAPRAAPVSTAVRACPGPGIRGSAFSQLSLIAVGSGHGAGQAQLTRLGTGAGVSVGSITQPGSLSVTAVPGAPGGHAGAPSPVSGQAVPTSEVQGGTVIEAAGSMARGLEAEQVDPGTGVSVRCAGPGTGFWFVGPGRDSVHNVWLYLMNVGSQPAAADVEAFTDSGPVLGAADTGIAIAPHSMLVQSLNSMLSSSSVIALFVRTSVGQVVAAAEEGSDNATSGSWLPAAVPPAQRVVIPALPGTAGTRQVFIAVPGSQDAHITLTVITSKGAYEPTGGSGLDIPGGSAFGVSLPSLTSTAGALEVSANVPVTASLVAPGGPSGTPGVFTAASAPVAEQGVAAENSGAGGTGSQLVLSAPGKAVTVRVTTGGSASGPPQTVQIPAHSSVVDQLRPPTGARRSSDYAVTVVPLPGSGPLYAGRVLVRGRGGFTLQALLPLTSALSTVPLRAVSNAVLRASG